MQIQDGTSSEESNKIKAFFKTYGRTVTVLIGCVLISLVSAASQSIPSTLDKIKNDLQLSDSEYSLLVSFGIVGLFFNLPAGLLLDRIYELKLTIAGGVLATAGWIGMSFCKKQTFALMVICFTLSGFGGGATFLCSMGASVKSLVDKPGLAISISGASMSLSMAFTNSYLSIYRNVSGCDQDDCWPSIIRVIAGMYASFVAIGCLTFLFLPKPIFELEKMNSESHLIVSELLEKEKEKNEFTQTVTFKESLKILANVFFIGVSLSYLIGVSAGLIVVTGGTTLWEPILPQSADKAADITSTCFSVANAIIGGLGSGWLSDYLSKKGILRTKMLGGVFLFYSVVFVILMGISLVDRGSDFVAVIWGFLLSITGALWGVCYTLVPAIVSESYGQENFGVYFGYMQFLTVLSTFLIPQFVSMSLDEYDNLIVLFFSMCILLAFSALFLLLKEPTPANHTPEFDKLKSMCTCCK
eukprot:TRINITY_DN723_c0_g1_i1.p1 TRINITY_DN723_c0_g1~~TRINITY_DN723_c0_g1_i1.p1  ORF type:complete len:471 (-),score=203.91 TRINITY_DN723_c0_g1_i1:616-2028(-)